MQLGVEKKIVEVYISIRKEMGLKEEEDEKGDRLRARVCSDHGSCGELLPPPRSTNHQHNIFAGISHK